MIRFHHVGVVVQDIAEHVSHLSETYGWAHMSEIYTDPVQKVRVAFVNIGNQAQIELIEPLGEDSPVQNALRKGGGLHHVCYEVDDIEAAVKRTWENGAVVIREPVPAVAFHGRRIAFVFGKDRTLTEFVERARLRDGK
jgi:methylmalonyl-CoA/ethylmalonyl-CoA epimerase